MFKSAKSTTEAAAPPEPPSLFPLPLHPSDPRLHKYKGSTPTDYEQKRDPMWKLYAMYWLLQAQTLNERLHGQTNPPIKVKPADLATLERVLKSVAETASTYESACLNENIKEAEEAARLIQQQVSLYTITWERSTFGAKWRSRGSFFQMKRWTPWFLRQRPAKIICNDPSHQAELNDSALPASPSSSQTEVQATASDTPVPTATSLDVEVAPASQDTSNALSAAAIPSATVPQASTNNSASSVSMFDGASNFTTTGGTFSSGLYHTQSVNHYHFYGPSLAPVHV